MSFMQRRMESSPRVDRAVVLGANAAASSAIAPELPMRVREALVLWLRWNDAYERATAQAYRAGGDPEELERLMDHMDELRRQAIQLSRQSLDE